MFGVPVVTNARAFYTTRAAAGATGTRHSPLPFWGREVLAQLGRFALRDRRLISGIKGRRHCERKRSNLVLASRIWIASLALAMTAGIWRIRAIGSLATTLPYNSWDNRADIRDPERYINPARHVRAFGVRMGNKR